LQHILQQSMREGPFLKITNQSPQSTSSKHPSPPWPLNQKIIAPHAAWTDAIMRRRSPRQRPAKDACYQRHWERRRNLSNSPSLSLLNNNEPAAANPPAVEDNAAAAEEFDGPDDAAVDEEFNSTSLGSP
jgi:hypothetical protein